MVMILTQCPCGACFRIGENRIGQRAKCPKCGDTFKIAMQRMADAKRKVRAATAEQSAPATAEIVADPQMADGPRIDVRVSDPEFANSVPVIRKLLDESMLNSEVAFPKVNLTVTVTAWDEGSQLLRWLFTGLAGAAVCSLDIRGQVNGQTYEMTTTKRRYMGFFGGNSDGMIRSAGQKCVWAMEKSMEAGAPAAPTSLNRTWHRLGVVRWLVSVVLAFVAAAWNVAITSSGPPGALGVVLGVWMAVLLGGTAFGTMLMLTLLFMPGRFYTSDVKGARILKKTGVNSPAMVRVVAAVLAVIFLAVFLLFLVLSIRGE